MKKLLMVAVMAVAGTVLASTEVYDFKMNLEMPVLKSGIRNMVSCSFKGYMYMEYENDEEGPSSVWIECKNKKTDVTHRIEFTEGFYNLMGKADKKIGPRRTPTIYFEGGDVDNESHENIKKMNLCGSGTLKLYKGAGCCGFCGDTPANCIRLVAMNGKVNGTMICNCPDDIPWTHTLMAGICGLLTDDGNYMRTQEACFYGSWSAKRNEKLSE